MGYGFNADEIFEIAEQIERNGGAFYRRVAEMISGDDIHKFFIELADMEAKHERVFAAMRSELRGKEREAQVFDPEDESSLYLKALADLRVFDSKQEAEFASIEQLPENQRMVEVLKKAIGMEKESIVFYSGMKGLILENSGKERIDHIIDEEMKHIRLLSSRLVSVR